MLYTGFPTHHSVFRQVGLLVLIVGTGTSQHTHSSQGPTFQQLNEIGFSMRTASMSGNISVFNVKKKCLYICAGVRGKTGDVRVQGTESRSTLLHSGGPDAAFPPTSHIPAHESQEADGTSPFSCSLLPSELTRDGERTIEPMGGREERRG